MVPNKVLRLFSKKQDDDIDHSLIRKPYKVEWAKQHETKESSAYMSYRTQLKIDDFDPSANWNRHRSSPVPVNPKQLAIIDGHDRRNNTYSFDGKWDPHGQTLSNKKFGNIYLENEQFANETLKNNSKANHQRTEPILTDANAKPKNTQYSQIYQRTEPILPASKKIMPIMDANAKPKNTQYSQIDQQTELILPNSKKILNPIVNVNDKDILYSQIHQRSDIFPNSEKIMPIVAANIKPKNTQDFQINQRMEPVVPDSNANVKPKDTQIYQQTEPVLSNSKKNTNPIVDANDKDTQIPQLQLGTCPTCEGPIAEAGYHTQWCSTCQSKLFEKKFGSWSSGNDDIDIFILETQLASPSRFDYLEWIPYNRFKDVQLVGSGGYGDVYQAIWLDGPRERWDTKTVRYMRCGKQRVALRPFNNLNIDSEFFIELAKFLNSENNSGTYVCRYYGITQDPISNNYMMVIQYARDGNLRKYYKQNFASITWQKRLDILYGIAIGLTRIHGKDIIHRNLHSGNVLIHSSMILLSDLGLSILLKDDSHNKEGVYGVLPFMAPEILRNQQFTKESDAYSFGILMWELAFGKQPFSNRAHDLALAIDICEGLRPEFEYEIPECYASLIKRCLNFDPFARPTAEQLYGTLGEWLCMVSNVPNSNIAEQFREAEERQISLKNECQADTLFLNDIHPEAIYVSRHYNFKDLELPTIIFTRTNERGELLAVQQYITNETRLYNTKLEMIRAENSDIAAEVYEILQYL